MKKFSVFLCPLALIFILTANLPDAEAITYTSSPGASFGDGVPVYTDTIAVPDTFLIADMSISLDISHTWVGDLLITVEGPNTDTITLVDRPGLDPPGSDGCCGNGADLTGIYVFDDIASASLPESGSVPPGTYLPDTTVGHTFSSIFFGDNIFGNWTLEITDKWSSDTGTLRSWTIEAQPIPEPASMLLLGSGLAGLAGLRRKLRKK